MPQRVTLTLPPRTTSLGTPPNTAPDAVTPGGATSGGAKGEVSRGTLGRVWQFLRAHFAPVAVPAPRRSAREVAMHARNAGDRTTVWVRGPQF